MPRPRIHVTRPIAEEALAQLQAAADVTTGPADRESSRTELLNFVKPCDGLLVVGHPKVDGELMDAASGLKMIANFGVGVDHIDVAAATQRGIWVSNTAGSLTETTAQLAWALILAATRRGGGRRPPAPRGRMEGLRPLLLPGHGTAGQNPGHYRRGPHRPGRGAQGVRLRNERGLLEPPAEAGIRDRDRRHASRARRLAQRERYHRPHRVPYRRNPAPDRRARVRPDEAHGLPGQHRPRPGGRRSRPRPSPPRPEDRRRRARRLREGAGGAPRPAPLHERRPGPAHRKRDDRDAAAHVDAGGRKLPGRSFRGASPRLSSIPKLSAD